MDSFRGVRCLVKVGSAVRFDNVALQPPVGNSLKHTANFVASYAVGTVEYRVFVRCAMPSLSHSRVLMNLRPITNEKGVAALHLLRCGEHCWIARCASDAEQNFQFRGIDVERAETEEWFDCFAHFVLERSTRRYSVEVSRVSSCGELEEFRVHTNSSQHAGTDDWPFGLQNDGPAWIASFCRSHTCNAFCAHLRLPSCRRFL